MGIDGKGYMALTSGKFPLAEELQGTRLAEIVNSKWREVVCAKKKWPAEAVRQALERAPQVRSLKRVLLRSSPAIIAEIKRRSPTAGVLRPQADPPEIASEYRSAGAAAISVVTEGVHFGGQLECLARLRWTVDLPLLRKDFIVDPYQILESRHAGADAVLLIAGLLPPDMLRDLHEQARAVGMDALVEVHDERELERALDVGATLIGVNNRDLRTLEVSLDVSLRLAPRLPAGAVAVAESGIRSGEDIRKLMDAGYRAFLVGEHLMRSESPGRALARLIAAAGAAKGIAA